VNVVAAVYASQSHLLSFSMEDSGIHHVAFVATVCKKSKCAEKSA
jgi:hypothetical protein